MLHADVHIYKMLRNGRGGGEGGGEFAGNSRKVKRESSGFGESFF